MNKGKKIGKFFIYFFGFILGPSLISILLLLINPSISEILLNVICNGIYSIILFVILRKRIINDFKDYKNNVSNYLGLLFKYWGVALVVMMASNLLINYLVFNGNIAANEESVRKLIYENAFLSGISVVFLAPFSEEITFRYSMKGIFKNGIIYSLMSGFVFGLLHAITSISSPLDLLYIIPYGSLGTAFALLYHKTDNILVPISAHMLHNTITFALVLLAV